MLSEVNHVKQIKDEGFRRWFLDDFFDLIIWYDDHKNIVGFQLCYDKQAKERSLTWYKDRGYIHNKIDDGEIVGGMKRTPILVADGKFDKKSISQKFKESSIQLEKNIVSFVYQKLLEVDDEL